MNYQQLNEIVSKARKLPKTVETKTTIRKDADETIVVRHHSTDIVTAYPNGSFKLDTGGWMSKTTTERLCRYSPARIHQEGGLLWVSHNSERFPFKDGMVVKATGRPVHAKSVKKTEDAAKKVAGMISKYIRGFCEDIEKNGLEAPSGGDCWLCCMRDANGKAALGEGVDHVLSHMEEPYYVPSLLFNAAIERRANAAGATDNGVAMEQARRDFSYVMQFRSGRNARDILRHFFRRRRHLLVAALGG
jgi:hypothetical protein